MKMKKLTTILATTAAAISMSATVLAGSWHWIDVDGNGVQECYYFTDDGNFLTNTVTPDGYQVNAAGQWTENGVVQTQGQPIQTQVRTQRSPKLIGLQEGTYILYELNQQIEYAPVQVTIANGTLTVRHSYNNGQTEYYTFLESRSNHGDYTNCPDHYVNSDGSDGYADVYADGTIYVTDYNFTKNGYDFFNTINMKEYNTYEKWEENDSTLTYLTY